jgi:D-alanyl-D-alanine carboxypeptidase
VRIVDDVGQYALPHAICIPVPVLVRTECVAAAGTVHQTAKELTTPGAVVIYQTAQGVLRSTYGAKTVAGSPPVSFDDHFRIGSITKTFTGTVILQLAQEGKLGIDDPVSKYRSDVPNGRNITLTQLLNMRSGLYNYSESLEFNTALDETPRRAWAPDELLAMAYQTPPYFAPGKGYHYTNTGLILLGLIVEKIEGNDLATSFQKRLFDPLGMHETVFPARDSFTLPAPHPQGYMYGTNVSTIESATLPESHQAAISAGTLKPTDVTDQNPSWAWAAGAAISTVQDVLSWVTAMGDGSLLNAEWQRKRLNSLQPVNPQEPNAGAYGLAIVKLGPMYGHTGELPGFQSFCGYDPDKKNGLVVLANLNAAPNGDPVASTISKSFIETVYS